MRNTKEGASPSLFSLAFKLTSLAVLCGLLLVIVIMGYSASAAKKQTGHRDRKRATSG